MGRVMWLWGRLWGYRAIGQAMYGVSYGVGYVAMGQAMGLWGRLWGYRAMWLWGYGAGYGAMGL